LKFIWNKQNGLCALTGRPLDNNSELDHIIPISRGGDNSIENYRWLCRDANQAKHSLTDEEFFNLCKAITESNLYTEWIGKQIMEVLNATMG
jgi:5-methylcytosine-specific restriction endonuclease McrA